MLADALLLASIRAAILPLDDSHRFTWCPVLVWPGCALIPIAVRASSRASECEEPLCRRTSLESASEMDLAVRMRLGAKDAWQTLGQRAMISVLAVVVTGGLVYLATDKPTTALLGIAAWPILLVGAGLVYSVGRLFGYDRLWINDSQVAPGGTGINAQLRTKGGPLSMPLRYGSEITSVVYDPAGQATRIDDIRALARGWVFFSYPEPGGTPGPLVPGSYWISWQWRKPDKSKWHVYAAHRVVVRPLSQAARSSSLRPVAGVEVRRAPHRAWPWA